MIIRFALLNIFPIRHAVVRRHFSIPPIEENPFFYQWPYVGPIPAECKPLFLFDRDGFNYLLTGIEEESPRLRSRFTRRPLVAFSFSNEDPNAEVHNETNEIIEILEKPFTDESIIGELLSFYDWQPLIPVLLRTMSWGPARGPTTGEH